MGRTVTSVCVFCANQFSHEVVGRGRPHQLCSDGCRMARDRQPNKEYQARKRAARVAAGGRLMYRDRFGTWHDWLLSHGYNSDVGRRYFGGGFYDPVEARLTLYRHDRWHLVCPHCRRSLVAKKAARTRRANRAAEPTGPDLFAGCE